MTDLIKKIRRRSTGRHRGARFVVELLHGDIAGFRRERTRTWFYIELSACYDLAIKLSVAAKKRETAAQRALQRKRR